MNVFLWILQGLLAVAFLGSGLMKTLGTREQAMKRGMAYAEDLTDTQYRIIGIAELLGAVGLILPAVTGIATILTPIAATGLAVTMVGALALHARRHELAKTAAVPGVLLVLAVIVAWGRFGPYAF
ncbi:MAG TPA: DoxX family protein [Micromonosporaceae bacterium]|nr:DoxX family protein [Micromonosporaceae bacterium]